MTNPIHNELLDFIAISAFAHLMQAGRKGLRQASIETANLACNVIERERGCVMARQHFVDEKGGFQEKSVAALAQGLAASGQEGLKSAVRDVYASIFAAADLPVTPLYKDLSNVPNAAVPAACAPVSKAAHDVETKVMKCIVELLGLEHRDVTPSKTFVADLGADSLDLIELTMAFEDEFDIEISDEDAERVVTVQEAFDLVHRLLVPAAGQR